MGLVVERLSVGIFHVTEGSGESTIGDKHIEWNGATLLSRRAGTPLATTPRRMHNVRDVG
jgi:hypothetical protein